jgi:hypothetical protein
MESLTYERALALAEEIVAERGPDFVYNSDGKEDCFYVPTTDPRLGDKRMTKAPAGGGVTGCLVGEIISRAGLMTDAIAESFMSVSELIEREYLSVDGERVEAFLRTLQVRQDSGTSWGEALADAKSKAGEVA